MLLPTLLIPLALFYPRPSLAVLQCFGWQYLIDDRLINPFYPQAHDCRYLIARLPSPPPAPVHADPDSSPNASLPSILAHLHNPSAPFFPHASVGHGTCLLVVNYYAGALPNAPFLDDSHESGQIPSAALLEATVLKIWQIAREAAERIVAECMLVQPRGGGEAGVLNLREMAAAWYKVEFWHAPGGSWEPSKAELMQQASLALAGGAGPEWSSWVGNVFGQTFYEL